MSEPKASLDEGDLRGRSKYQTHEPAQYNDELARFREAWRAEVKYRKQLAQGGGSASVANKAETEDKRPLEHMHAPSLQGITPLGYKPMRRAEAGLSDESVPRTERTTVLATTTTNFTSAQVSAIQVYGRAVAAEETGDLDAALQLYRTAFRRYDTVDRLWRAAEVQSLQKKFALKSDAMSHEPTTGAGTMVRDMAALSLDTQSAVPENSAVIQQAAHTASVTGILEKVLVNFPPVLEFEIDDSEVAKTRTATLNSIPDELLTKVLLYFSPRTIERFALVCRRARVVTLDTVIWKAIAEAIYKPPQIAQDETLTVILERYSAPDYRRLYIEQPRVRLDGVYIAVCHYVRHGTSDNPWVNMTHLISYHRYIRFYPNGQVLSLLANEHDDPQHIIATLNLSLRMKGLSIGTWHIAQPPPDSDSDSDKQHSPLVYIDNLRAREPFDSAQREDKYHFQMSLSLRSRPLGRWNRLDFVRYASVTLDTGEIVPFPLKQERPFWFSKVLSFGSGQNMDKERISSI